MGNFVCSREGQNHLYTSSRLILNAAGEEDGNSTRDTCAALHKKLRRIPLSLSAVALASALRPTGEG